MKLSIFLALLMMTGCARATDNFVPPPGLKLCADIEQPADITEIALKCPRDSYIKLGYGTYFLSAERMQKHIYLNVSIIGSGAGKTFLSTLTMENPKLKLPIPKGLQ